MDDRWSVIRHQVEDEPNPEWLLREDVRRGLRAVADAGLVYDLLVRPPQRRAAHTAAAKLQDVLFVLDHAGKPNIAAREGAPWASWITSMAGLRNVVCKLSGLVTEAPGTPGRPTPSGRTPSTSSAASAPTA